jgi:hypothetical protein
MTRSNSWPATLWKTVSPFVPKNDYLAGIRPARAQGLATMPVEALASAGPYLRYPPRKRQGRGAAPALRVPASGSGYGRFASFISVPLPPAGTRSKEGSSYLEGTENMRQREGRQYLMLKIGCLRQRGRGFASSLTARSPHHPMQAQSGLIPVP